MRPPPARNGITTTTSRAAGTRNSRAAALEINVSGESRTAPAARPNLPGHPRIGVHDRAANIESKSKFCVLSSPRARAVRERTLGNGEDRRQPVGVADVEEHPLGELPRHALGCEIHDEERLASDDLRRV